MGTGRRSGCGYSGCLLLTVGLCAFATVWVKFSFSFFFLFSFGCIYAGYRLGMRLVFVVIGGLVGFSNFGGFGSLFFRYEFGILVVCEVMLVFGGLSNKKPFLFYWETNTENDFYNILNYATKHCKNENILLENIKYFTSKNILF